MAVFAQCDFSGDVATTLLDAHTTADLTPHPTWVKSGAGSGTAAISNAARVRATSSSAAVYYASQAPADADYSVLGTLHVFANNAGAIAWLMARSSVTPTNTSYNAGYRQAVGGWEIAKFGSGTLTSLVTAAITPTVGQDYALRFEVEGTALRLYVDGVLTLSTTDAAISAKGLAGLRLALGSDTTGHHIDNWSADDVVISNPGTVQPAVQTLSLLGVG